MKKILIATCVILGATLMSGCAPKQPSVIKDVNCRGVVKFQLFPSHGTTVKVDRYNETKNRYFIVGGGNTGLWGWVDADFFEKVVCKEGN